MSHKNQQKNPSASMTEDGRRTGPEYEKLLHAKSKFNRHFNKHILQWYWQLGIKCIEQINRTLEGMILKKNQIYMDCLK